MTTHAQDAAMLSHGQDLIPVGGCHGIHLVPRAGLVDYYRAHAYAALAACACLGAVVLAGFIA